MWTLALPMPAQLQHRAALDRGERAIQAAKELRAEMAACTPRVPTLVGVAAQSTHAPAWAPHVAAGLGPRPSARGASR
jgi:hypothetical protein